ncbi:MAG: response regulator transcription factor [Candidatus Promineifilaceae bacterium]
MRGLLIATEPEERDFLHYALNRIGLQIVAAKDPEQALQKENPFDIIIICAHTAERIRTVEHIRSLRKTPIYLISDLLTEKTHCNYLDAGVDTVSERPYSMRLFERYTRMLLKRGGTVPASMLSIIQADWIQLDPANRTVTVEGYPAKRLTQLEFRLLYILMTHREQVIPTDELVERVWGYEGEGNRDLVRGLVRRLRKKIENPGSKPFFIRNLPGVGYIFSTEV